MSLTPESIVMIVIVLLSISIHEFAHAVTADMAGDPTPRSQGRVTLNPLAHLDPMGTLMIVLSSMVGFGIGWGKPVQSRPDKMRNPRWDFFFSVAAGPISNLVQAAVYALVFRIGVMTHQISLGTGEPTLTGMGLPAFVLLAGVIINLQLAFFNLIPFGPLDGHWLVGLLMPEKPRYHWFKFCHTYGGIILLGLILMTQSMNKSITSLVFGPIVPFITRFLLGF